MCSCKVSNCYYYCAYCGQEWHQIDINDTIQPFPEEDLMYCNENCLAGHEADAYQRWESQMEDA